MGSGTVGFLTVEASTIRIGIRPAFQRGKHVLGQLVNLVELLGLAEGVGHRGLRDATVAGNTPR